MIKELKQSLPQIYFFLAINLFIILAIFQNNDFTFIYTLDDPYIHLAVAENILQGHYGVNSNEFSSPSSSILWPFLLALLHLLSLKLIPLKYIPLIINIFSGIGMIAIARKLIYKIYDSNIASKIFNILLVTLVLGSNTFGLIYLGMEHSLQVLIVIYIGWKIIESDTIDNWLLFFIILAPLIRYENLAISVGALLYYYLKGERGSILLALIMIALLVTSFSIFLVSVGLDPLPASVMLKRENSSNSMLQVEWWIIAYNMLKSPMLAFLFLLSIYGVIKKKEKRLIAYSLIFTLILHFTFGRTGWLYRYEMYAIAYAIVLLFFIYKDEIVNVLKENYLLKSSIITIALVMLNFFPFLTQINLEVASNNIYSQQYIMSKIAKNYNKPIAVNDLGLVSFENPNYVLDLYGLASKEAKIARQTKDIKKMQNLIVKHNVGLVMIYDNWFLSLPKEWKKVATLTTNGKRVSPIGKTVSFYTTGVDDKKALQALKGIKEIVILKTS